MIVSLRLAFEVKERKKPNPDDIISHLRKIKKTYIERGERLDNAEGKRCKKSADCVDDSIKEINHLVENDMWYDFVESVENDDFDFKVRESDERLMNNKSR